MRKHPDGPVNAINTPARIAVSRTGIAGLPTIRKRTGNSDITALFSSTSFAAHTLKICSDDPSRLHEDARIRIKITQKKNILGFGLPADVAKQRQRQVNAVEDRAIQGRLHQQVRKRIFREVRHG